MIQINLIPTLLGDGVRLFDQLAKEHIKLERARVIETSGATHMRFRVLK